MPDTPPGRYHGHPAESIKKIKDQDEAKSGILDACLNRNSPDIRPIQPVPLGKPVPAAERKQIVEKNQKKNEVQIIDDLLEVGIDRHHHKTQKDDHGQNTDSPLNSGREPRKEVLHAHTQYNRHDNELQNGGYDLPGFYLYGLGVDLTTGNQTTQYGKIKRRE